MTPHEKHVFDLVRSELKPAFVPLEYRGKIDSEYCGHCHHATIAMYVLLNGRTKGYKVCKAIDELEIKHYWLVSPSGEIIDLTAEQYTNLDRPLPYNSCVNHGISHRRSTYAKAIISKLQPQLQLV